MRYSFIILFIIFLMGCSNKDTKFTEVDNNFTSKELANIMPIKVLEIEDLLHIPQKVSSFSKIIPEKMDYYESQKNYEKYYFSIWNWDKPTETLNSVKWPFESYCVGQSYGENFQPLKQDFFDEMLSNANFDTFATLNEKAVVLRETNIRAFPTNKPLLKDPSLAGEGFPFDYLQNSAIHANKPILVSHYSKDKEWAYIFSSFASGWIKTDEFVILDKKYSDIWQKAQQVRILKENVPIYTHDGKFLFKSKIGMMFALVSEDDKQYTILTVSSYKNNEPFFNKSKISKTVASRDVLTLSRENIDNIINEVSITNYGWGGMFEQRDCSSMLRDMFSPFGIWLPRNSYQQSKVGKVIYFDAMSDEEKIKLIKEKAVPFQTLLYKKGHIVLYVGTYNDEVIIFHNTWGIKTKKDGVEGRVVIGKPIFSTLKLGEKQENYDVDSEILRNLKSMNILTQ